jgi:hypothetical protein
LQVTVARLEERLAASERLGVAEARRNTELAETLSAERSRADRLEAALAEARKPALVRLVEALRRRT